ncbi:hypothetical protein GYMLUDRAFT_563040 [Collybiopsis luxurians FD-317 M1]|uniref:F-box domain-containing protein n=1 Tax=Collybiopsis luxurians FD-317 M1 TaxID=944289 RepID=A0A0D0CZP4_9AGAR|nr:hypothetical protein GYMLUDRAFT_563040 [Collybiopsis luxurians FD-317 M1]
MNFSEKESFSELAPHIVSCFEVLAQKIIVHDDGPTLDRLRHGDFAKTHVRLTDVDPFLEDATDRLVEYDRHISLVEEAFQKLKSARDSFKHSVEMTLSLLAPVRCLPEDVLVEIFSLYIQNCRNRRGSKERTYFLTLSEERRILSPNFTLSHVCSFWRKVVFSRPTFWSSFSLSAGALKTFEDESPIIPFLSECLSRTENAPLSLYIKLDLVDDNSDQKDAFGLFLKRAARWQHLDLFLYDHKLISPFVSWLQSGDQPLAFSTLRHLDLNGHFTEVTTDLLPIFSRGSRLETLSTGSLKVPWSDFSQCDFSSLKKLETSGFPGASVGQILGTVPSLEH